MQDQVPWENDIYARGHQINRWPFSEVVADVMTATRGLDRSSMSALEIGCGTGNNLWFLLDAGFRAAGIDVSSTAVQIAGDRLRSLGHAGCDLRVGDLASLPWADQSFDVVLDRGALTCVPGAALPAALAEVHRVLRPGGRFLSYYLFGMGHSDRQFGTECGPQTYEGFRTGRFVTEPLVSFYDEATIRRLWKDFSIEAISRHAITRCGDSTVEERFSVQARRPS